MPREALENLFNFLREKGYFSEVSSFEEYEKIQEKKAEEKTNFDDIKNPLEREVKKEARRKQKGMKVFKKTDSYEKWKNTLEPKSRKDLEYIFGGNGEENGERA